MKKHGKAGVGSALMGLALLAGGAGSAAAAENSVEQGVTPMDQINLANPQEGEPVAEKSASPFVRDAKVSAQARTYYFNRDNFDNSRNEAWTIGGSLGVKSGYAGNVFALGAVAYTSQPLYAPDDRDGTLLLQPGQEGYTVLGQIYGEFKFTEALLGAIGRKEYNTPYLNKNDVRMTPNTFEGISLYGTTGSQDGGGKWKYGGGYITKIKERNSDEFVWMSRDAGASVDRGVYVAGANYEQKNFSLGAANYYSDDIINIFYTEGKYSVPLAEGYKLKLAAQYTDQQSTGDNLLTGSDFSTHQWGIKGDLSVGAALFTLAYTDTGSGSNMRNPWSGYPGYTSVQVQDFNRAKESAVMLRAAYDFSRHGAQGVSAYALYVHGSGVDGPNYNQNEADLNLQWTPPKDSALRGMSFRMRYAHVDQRGGGDPAINDVRIIVNWDFPRP